MWYLIVKLLASMDLYRWRTCLRRCHLYGDGPNLLTKIDNRVYKQNQFYGPKLKNKKIEKIKKQYENNYIYNALFLGALWPGVATCLSK